MRTYQKVFAFIGMFVVADFVRDVTVKMIDKGLDKRDRNKTSNPQ